MLRASLAVPVGKALIATIWVVTLFQSASRKRRETRQWPLDHQAGLCELGILNDFCGGSRMTLRHLSSPAGRSK